jgi:hypothetical protein
MTRSQRTIVAAIVALAVIIAIITAIVGAIVGANDGLDDALSGTPVSCRIRGEDYRAGRLEFVMEDVSQIEQFVLKPLRESRRIADPEKYEIYGGLRLEFADGRSTGIMLFVPFGYFKLGGEYYQTDLMELMRAYNHVLELEAEIVNEQLDYR